MVQYRRSLLTIYQRLPVVGVAEAGLGEEGRRRFTCISGRTDRNVALCLPVQVLLQRKPVLIKKIRLDRTQCQRSQRYEIRTPPGHTVGKGFVIEDGIGKTGTERLVRVDLSRADIPLERSGPADDPTEVIEPPEITGDADPQIARRDSRPAGQQSHITGSRE